jgi:hypothetical protein
MDRSDALKHESAITGERSAERIRADLERTRAELAQLVQALRLEVARTVDWREWFRRHPAAFLMGAFTVGFIAGTRRRS